MKPRGALYAFPGLDPEVHEIHDDEQFVQDLLLQEKIRRAGQRVQPRRHEPLPIVTLPWAQDLTEAIERIGNSFPSHKQ